MYKKQLTFLSTRGRGLGVDLALLKTYLSETQASQLDFRFYLKNEMHRNANPPKKTEVFSDLCNSLDQLYPCDFNFLIM